MITKVAFALVTTLLLVAGDPDDVIEEEQPSTHNPVLISTSDDFEAVMGESVTFPCVVDDLGDYVLIWKTGHNRILFALPLKIWKDDRISVIHNTSLHISTVQPKDSGEYICQISTNPPIELTHTLNVLYPPSVKSHPKDGLVVAKEGEKVTLSCDATGNPKPDIKWKHMGRIYESTSNGNHGNHFVLDGVQKSDSGKYECIADNGVGDPATALITVDVVSAPVIYPHPKSGSVEIKEGEPFSISCEATGDPVPVITWKKPNGDTVSGEKINVTSSDRNQAGTYECIATNSLGISTSFEIEVQVQYEPEIEVPVQRLHTGEGTPVELLCIVHGEPDPNVTWKHEEVVLHSDGHYHPKNNGARHILQIRHVRESDFGTYECTAQNTLHRTSATIEVMGTPQVPSITSKPHGTQDTKYTIRWMVESHSAINEYSLSYRKKSTGGDWIPVSVIPSEQEESHSRNQSHQGESHSRHQSHQLTELEPDTEYEAVVTARNKFGWSSASENFVFRTKQGVPTTKMTKEPTMAATIAQEDQSNTNAGNNPGGDGNGSSPVGRLSFLAVVAQVLAVCILCPLFL